METFYLFDDKEFYFQEIIPEKNFSFVKESMPNNAFHILVREWNPETWKFGPIYEVKVDKNIHASKFSQFLSEKVFPHIPAETLFCSKVNNIRQFKRADLAIKRWNRLLNQNVWLGQSTLEVNRDAVYVIVKDNEIKLREELTEEEIKKYASNQYLDHIAKKYSRDINLQHRDALYDASQAAKPDYSKVSNRKAEVGIKITVGGPKDSGSNHGSNQQQQEETGVKINSNASDDKDTKKVNNN